MSHGRTLGKHTWKRIDRARSRFISKYTIQTKRALSKSFQRFNNILPGFTDPVAMLRTWEFMGLDDEPLEELLPKLYLTVGSYFIEDTLDGIKSSGVEGALVVKEFTGTAEGTDLLNDMREYIQRYGANKVVNINRNIQDMLTRELEKGIKRGDSVDVIKRNFKKRWSTLSSSRARTIARTEVMHSASYASDISAHRVTNSTGIPLKKIWLATPFGKYRVNHLDLDGKGVALGSMFNVGGGVLMKHPHDPTAPPGEVINCRCTVRYEPAGRRSDVVDLPKPEVAPDITGEVLDNTSIWDKVKTIAGGRRQLSKKYNISNPKMQGANLEQVNSIGTSMSEIFGTTEKLKKMKPPKVDELNFISFGKKKTGTNAHYFVSRYDHVDPWDFRKRPGEVRSAIEFNTTGWNRTLHKHGDDLAVGLDQHSVGGIHGSRIKSTMRHEYGHAMWYQVMSDVERKRWYDDLFVGREIMWWENVSHYSATNVKETFAEAFSAWTNPLYGSPSYKRLPQMVESELERLFGKRIE